MVGINNLPTVGFDESSFRREVEATLGKGLSEMIANAASKDNVWASYEKTDVALAKIVKDHCAPPRMTEWAKKRIIETLECFRREQKTRGVDTSKAWNSEMARVSAIILRAIGQMDYTVIRIDRLKDAAISAMTIRGNFSRQGAEMLINELSPLGCRDLAGLLGKLDDGPNSMEFIRFIDKNGTSKAREEAMRSGWLAPPRDEKTMHAPAHRCKVIPIPLERLRR